MGLRDKYAKRYAERGFTPLELNEANVQAVFSRCLATEEEKASFDKRILCQILKPELTKKESKEVILSREKVNANRSNIEFLLGQVKNIHTGSSAIGLQEGFMRYDRAIWTKNYDILFELFSLGQSCGWFTEFSALPDDPNIISALKASDVKPTLSPKDPAFPAWWEQHKAEWEDKAGQ